MTQRAQTTTCTACTRHGVDTAATTEAETLRISGDGTGWYREPGTSEPLCDDCAAIARHYELRGEAL